MHEILAMTLQGLQQNMGRVQSIAMNLSNAQTTAYKREIPVAQTFADMVSADGMPVSARAMPAARTPAFAIDMQAATLKSTGQALDLALASAGWFEIRTASGTAYTRQGNFQLDARGRLVTAHGDAVMGKSGEIVLPSDAVRIDAAGNIFDVAASAAMEDARPIAQLRIVQPESLEKTARSMRRLGDGLLDIDGAVVELADGALQLRQGYLENSNVSAMREMVGLMQTMRHFESLQKVAHAYDDMLGTAIRKLGDV